MEYTHKSLNEPFHSILLIPVIMGAEIGTAKALPAFIDMFVSALLAFIGFFYNEYL